MDADPQRGSDTRCAAHHIPSKAWSSVHRGEVCPAKRRPGLGGSKVCFDLLCPMQVIRTMPDTRCWEPFSRAVSCET